MPGSSTRRILTSDIQATPWKNGGGVTREIASGGGTGSRPGPSWGWRVSLAAVAQDGTFSTFTAPERVLAVHDGAGMDMGAGAGAVIALEPMRADPIDRKN